MKSNIQKLKKKKNERGIILVLILVFGMAFIMMLTSLVGLVALQLKQSSQKVAWHESLDIAEAGINYYKWCLNNGIDENCVGERNFYDLEGNLIGKFNIEATSTISCGETIKKNIISSGWTEEFPNVKRTISVIYARQSVAKFAYLINDNVWAGQDREIRGFYHSNGGIRMDGENQSIVSSGESEWVCTSSFGCSTCPTESGCRSEDGICYCPGVFTTTDNSSPDLFSYPNNYFDFGGITMDLALMKSTAQNYADSTYVPPSTNIDPGGKGYHIVFQNNGTFDVYIITNLDPIQAYSQEESWHDDYFLIDNEYFYANYPVGSECSLIFIEDNVWIEGEINGKTTIVSANLIDPNKDSDVVLTNDINYTTLSGLDGLVVIGENNILISPSAPDIMELRGIFLAQKGRFGINHYNNIIKDRLEIYGSIISNGRVGTQWVSGGQIISGFSIRENYFDSNLVYSPPPFVPYSEVDFKIINWEEL